MEWLNKRNAIRLTIAAVIFTLMQPAHADNEFYFTVGGYVDHIGSIGFVDADTLVYSDWQEGFDNGVLGFEVVDSDSQYGVGGVGFNNSYYNESVLIYGSKYWNLSDNLKVGVNIGAVTGYKDWQMYGRYKLDTSLHALVAPVVVAESDNMFTKFAIFGNAAVLTFGSKF